jgi:hypothetical protein
VNLLKKIGLIGVTLGTLAVNANAGVISLKNSTPDSSIGTSTLTAKNIFGATEGYMPFDGTFQESAYTNALRIYTIVEGNKLSTEARPIDTSGWDFYLGVKGSVSGIDNYLRYKITDTTDLEGKTLVIYDTANPSVTHPLLMDGAYHNINLPNLTASNSEYAYWRLDITPIVTGPLPGDANLDGIVDASDYITVKNNFGRNPATWSEEDFSGNGSVGFEDLQMLMSNFGARETSPAQAPGPATLGLLALGLPAIIRKKRKPPAPRQSRPPAPGVFAKSNFLSVDLQIRISAPGDIAWEIFCYD